MILYYVTLLLILRLHYISMTVVIVLVKHKTMRLTYQVSLVLGRVCDATAAHHAMPLPQIPWLRGEASLDDSTGSRSRRTACITATTSYQYLVV